ncbi:MAG TPA: hypothetical protein VNH18_13520 [Bryobacteraceae bacterium]|nr:hypothetical protein [Bryobacteraceae bacterium]
MMRNTQCRWLAVALLSCAAAAPGPLPAAEPPNAGISNGQITAKDYLPDPNNGFYRSTRFDWSGAIASLEYKGHNFYGPWFYKTDLAVYDLGYDDKGVVSAPFTAMVGPSEEFNTDGTALGFAEAKPGGTFVKIGVGVLRKPLAGEPPIPPPPARGGPPARAGAAPNAPVPVGPGRGGSDRYDHSRVYTIVDPGKWTVSKKKDSVEFTHELTDAADGYGYVYRKTLRLVPGKPQLVIEHSLKNTGTNPINTTVYNHNFLVLDNQGPSQDFTVTVPYQIEPGPRPPTAGLLEVRGNQLVYVKTLTAEDRATATLRGFGDTAKDYDIRVENKKLGAGYHVVGDRPLSNVAVWSIRTVNAVEPYVAMSIDPGKNFTWTLTYDYFTTSPAK